MRGCYILREEPEFRDLYFDPDKTVEVTVRVMQKHEERAAEVAQASRDEQQMFYDDVRIEIIDQLATPQFRRDFLRRLGECQERLKGTNKVKKLEMALFLDPILRQKEVPWGLCGLVTTIYEETKEKALREYEEEQELFEELLEALGGEADVEELLAMAEDPELLAAFTKKLEAKPALRERIERDIDQWIREIGEAIAQGEVELGLFTEEEILLAMVYFTDYAQRLRPEEYRSEAVSYKFLECMQRAIADIMTPARVEAMEGHLDRLFLTWAKSKDERKRRWAPHVQAVRGSLSSWGGYHENPILLSEYLYRSKELQERARRGQIRDLEEKFNALVEKVRRGEKVMAEKPGGEGLWGKLRRTLKR